MGSCCQRSRVNGHPSYLHLKGITVDVIGPQPTQPCQPSMVSAFRAKSMQAMIRYRWNLLARAPKTSFQRLSPTFPVTLPIVLQRGQGDLRLLLASKPFSLRTFEAEQSLKSQTDISRLSLTPSSTADNTGDFFSPPDHLNRLPMLWFQPHGTDFPSLCLGWPVVNFLGRRCARHAQARQVKALDKASGCAGSTRHDITRRDETRDSGNEKPPLSLLSTQCKQTASPGPVRATAARTRSLMRRSTI